MTTPIAVFPLTRCTTCGGNGELHTSHSFDCFDCGGIGYRWNDHEIPRGHAPNITLTGLIIPCCEFARKGLWANAEQKRIDHLNLVQRIAQGQGAQRDLDRMLASMTPKAVA